MRRLMFAASAGITLLGAVAVSQTVTFDFDRSASFSAYKTYAWTRGTELTDELIHGRIVRAVDARLLEKGLSKVEPGGGPDVLVAYHASLDKNLRIDAFSTGWGPFGLGPERSGSARVQEILLGTIVVDMIDARTRALVWRAMATGEVKPTDKPEQRDRKMAKATEKMFSHYPPRP